MASTGKKKLVTMNVSLTKQNLDDIDKIKEERGCASRSEVIRRLIDEAKRRGWFSEFAALLEEVAEKQIERDDKGNAR